GMSAPAVLHPMPHPEDAASPTPQESSPTSATASTSEYAAPASARPRLPPTTRQRLLSLAVLVGFFLIWEVACLATGVSDLILPRPTQIASVLFERLPLLWPHTVQTLYTTVAGFVLGVLVGIVLGVIVGSSRLAYDV